MKLQNFLYVLLPLVVVSHKNVLIFGGGPCGLFAALELFQNLPRIGKVEVVEHREIVRPQCVRVPPAVLSSLPEDLKVKLWPDDSIRSNLTSSQKSTNPLFWPWVEDMYKPIFSIGEFQLKMIQFLQATYGDGFKYTTRLANPNNFNNDIKGHDLVIVATGNGEYNQKLRENLKLLTKEDKHEKISGESLYVTFRSAKYETFYRSPPQQKAYYIKSCTTPFFYAPSNDESKHVQISGYIEGRFKAAVLQPDNLSEEMIENLKFRSDFTTHFTLDGQQNKTEESEEKKYAEFNKSQSDGTENPRSKEPLAVLHADDRRFLKKYSDAVIGHLDRNGIDHPGLNEMSVFYGPRYEYYYTKVAAEIDGTPLLFFGDSAGGTDHAEGFSLGRGLIAIQDIIQKIKTEQECDIVKYYNDEYWNSIVKNEFYLKGKQPYGVKFKYFMSGRQVDGNLIDKDAHAEFCKTHKIII